MTIPTHMLSLCLLSVGTLASAQDITFLGVPAKDCEPMRERMKKLTPEQKARLTLDPSTLTPEQLQAMQQEAIDKAPTPERHALNPPCKPHEEDKQFIQGISPWGPRPTERRLSNRELSPAQHCQ